VKGVPRAALLCALVACLNAACWSLLSPPFQVLDEPDHYAYVKQLAETGTPPASRESAFSPEENQVLEAEKHLYVRLAPQHHTISSANEVSQFQAETASIAHTTGSRSAGVAASQPPLYYAAEAIPYLVAGGSPLDRLLAMRLVSALFAGVTALFAYLFLREAIPSTRWAWSVGGLAVALTPLLGEMSGAVNPDALLFAASAASLYLLARGFRRGLDRRLAVSLGVAMAIGVLSKLNFMGLAPGLLLGMAVLGVRAARTAGRRAYLLSLLAATVGLSPAMAFSASSVLSGHGPLGKLLTNLSGSMLKRLNYAWQLYLPHIPGTTNDFPGLFTTRQIWFNGYVGLYGWFDTRFPNWVYDLALLPAAAIAIFCGREIVRHRASLRGRGSELAVYATMTIGLLMLIAAASYLHFPEQGANFAEPRYLIPLVPLLGAIVALAARGAGRRWGPVVGALLVLLFVAHDVFSQMLVAARYYG
jgi:4-amino-4-deoxy-L-arabinose transferase-like glycosyltransferase